MSARLVLATHNAHKVGELRAILAPVLPGLDPASVVGARDVGAPEPVEDGVTFVENALIKARALAAFTGLPAVADDSGLSVDVLGGAPGIFSARWAGRHGDDAANLALLLAQLADIAEPHRSARFVCAAALVTPDGFEHVETGHARGRAGHRAARGRRLRLRPDPRAHGRDPVVRGADARRRRTRSATAARRSARWSRRSCGCSADDLS